MSGQADDLPPEAAKALPLTQAFWAHADQDLVTRYRDITARLEREGQWVRRRSGDPLLTQLRELAMKLVAGFVAKLRDGEELTAWGREGSPVAPLREIPRSAWSMLEIDDVGNVKGPGVTLFDVRVGCRVTAPAAALPPERTPVPVPPLPETGAPGRPSHMHLIKREFERRREAGQLESSLKRESEFLERWFKLNHPDKNPTAAKTIANNLSEPYREAKRQ